ncbi:MAG: molybdopterin-dependent oxidoreductase [Chloroflexi bacterium]|nr:molybdopterin-dependent oxidoreductase [Chloroflexota bacterium]
MADEITITIDGLDIKTPPGKTVLEAAIAAGIYIPYLCYHPGMEPFAACRMCVVAVEGGRGFPASCTLPVQDGMKIRNESQDVNDLRRSVMEMLIAEHPNGCLTCHRVDICGPNDVCLRNVSVNDRCVTCPKNERCEFKDTVRYLGMELESPLEYKYRQIPLEVSDPFYDRDMNLCITCGRCVRVCEEVRGDSAICFTEHSGKALVGTSFGLSLLESGCEFCGACIDVCPVGALVERDYKWEKARRIERTICPHCPVGCQLNLEFNAQGQMIRAVPELNSPSNHGQACFKGKFGLQFLNDPDRLEHPLVRRNGRLEPATWDEALDLIATRFGEFKGDSFALLAASNSTNEELYLAQKFARSVMNTNNVVQTSDIQPELTLGLERSFGYAAATNSIWEIERSGCILAFNTNLTEEQNVVGVPIKKATRKGAKLIVIDPREVELTRYATLWLRPLPGTELLLLGGILKSLIDQNLEKTEWIEENCEDPTTLYYALHSVDMAYVERLTHVSQDTIAEAARMFAQSESSAVVYALDNIPQDLQRDCVLALANLALLTGEVGQPGGGVFPMRSGMNEQGAWDVGCAPNRLPGNRSWRDDTAVQAVETGWNCTLPTNRGLGVAGAVAAAREGQVKAMLVIGDSPNFNNGRLGDGYAALQQLDFLVVHDSFLGQLSENAHVVLPRTTFAEKEGTYTNLERRIQHVEQGMPPRAAEAKPEQWVIAEIARRMGASGFDHSSPSEVMDEIASISPIYSGVSYQLIDAQVSTVFRSGLDSPQPTQLLYSSQEHRGIQWPCTASRTAPTPVLYQDGFPNGKANPVTPEFSAPEPHQDPDYSGWLVPGRVLLQSDQEATIEKTKSRGKLNRLVRDELVRLHPSYASNELIGEGDAVQVNTPQGTHAGLARLDDTIPPGMIGITRLFAQLAVDLQVSQEKEPMSRVPGLDILPARISKLVASDGS